MPVCHCLTVVKRKECTKSDLKFGVCRYLPLKQLLKRQVREKKEREKRKAKTTGDPVEFDSNDCMLRNVACYINPSS